MGIASGKQALAHLTVGWAQRGLHLKEQPLPQRSTSSLGEVQTILPRGSVLADFTQPMFPPSLGIRVHVAWMG